MTIRRGYRIAALATVLLLAILGYLVVRIYERQETLVDNQRRRVQSFRVAGELKASSDLLTMMARLYTVTGDPVYERYFSDILAIRNGEAPMPEQYSPVYWDLVMAGRRPHLLDGERQSFTDRLRGLGFTERELGLLAEARARSDRLVGLEREAFEAMKAAGADPAKARSLTHGPEYLRQKGLIMEPISAFIESVEARTADAVVTVETSQARHVGATIALTALMSVVALAGIAFTTRRVVAPIGALDAHARRIARGDYASRNVVGGEHELGTLGEALNGMSEAIERDVAERTRLANELQRAKEAAESADRAKSAFLAMVSHEIRTPMNAVINMTGLTLDTELTPTQRQYLGVVDGSARTLMGLLNDILDFSKIEAERLELEQAPFRVRGLVDEVADTFRGKVLEKHIEFVVQVAPDVPPMLVGDALRLRQVLVNLIGNAFKFTDEGEVVLSVTRAGGAPGDAAATIEFSVRDTGIGIPLDRQARLFQPFTQADVSMSRKYGGTGLGLAISRRLVRLMGGEILVTSEPGRGSTFSFGVPLGIAAGAAHTEADLPAAMRGRRVLVVEDNRTTREVIATILEGFGLVPVAVGSGEDAMTAMTSPGFDLVLLDWLLPGMNGIEVATRLRARADTASLPIVMVSAYAGREEEAECRAVGVNAFLTKPITASSLHDTIAGLWGAPARAVPAMSAPDAREFAGARVLLAEDNETNQRVAREVLARVGITLDVAVDGIEAIEKVRQHEYAAVLMDLHMPGMDGLEATRRIRMERDGRPLPIIAMTASAMKGDVEACLAAGMDDYVAKPIDRHVLYAALRRWIAATPGHSSEPPHVPEPQRSSRWRASDSSIDTEGALRRLGVDEGTLGELLRRFAAGARDTLAALVEAAAAGDRAALRRHAHTLAGAAGNVGAVGLAEAAKALERAAGGDADVDALVRSVTTAAATALASIATLGGSPSARPEATIVVADARALAAALPALARALAEADPTAAQHALAAARAAGAPEALRADLATLARLVDDYDFEGALTLTRRLVAALPGERA